MMLGVILKRLGVPLVVVLWGAQPSWAASTRCSGVDYSDGDKASERETICLTELRSTTNRKGEMLTVHFENGATKRWRSDKAACAREEAKDCVEYFLIGYQPTARVYSILAQYYEGSGVDIVNAAAGQTLNVHGMPHFSPDGLTFVVLNNDLENDAPGDFSVGMGTTVTTPASVVWKYNSSLEWSFQKWIDNDHVLLHGSNPGASDPCKEGCDFIVVRYADKWAMTHLPAK